MPTATSPRPPEKYVDDSRFESAPKMPSDRPATKAEVFAYWSHTLDGVHSPDEIKAECRRSWAWCYVRWVNFKGWDKQPDWVPGDPVIHEAVPAKPFPAGSIHIERVEELWQLARQIKRERYGS